MKGHYLNFLVIRLSTNTHSRKNKGKINAPKRTIVKDKYISCIGLGEQLSEIIQEAIAPNKTAKNSISVCSYVLITSSLKLVFFAIKNALLPFLV